MVVALPLSSTGQNEVSPRDGQQGLIGGSVKGNRRWHPAAPLASDTAGAQLERGAGTVPCATPFFVHRAERPNVQAAAISAPATRRP